jgi:hypothetical protein
VAGEETATAEAAPADIEPAAEPEATEAVVADAPEAEPEATEAVVADAAPEAEASAPTEEAAGDADDEGKA